MDAYGNCDAIGTNEKPRPRGRGREQLKVLRPVFRRLKSYMGFSGTSARAGTLGSHDKTHDHARTCPHDHWHGPEQKE